jgi:hypothetical protein
LIVPSLIFGAFANLGVQEGEKVAARQPSRNVEIRLGPEETVDEIVADIIRREGYFRAVLVLIQSRGVLPLNSLHI